MSDPYLYEKLAELEARLLAWETAEIPVLQTYNEGNWTPTIEGTSSNPTGVTYSIRTGFYVRHGSICTCWGRTTISGISAAGTGAIAISGLPFASNIGANINGNVSLSYVSDLDNAPGIVQLVGYVENNAVAPRAIIVETLDNTGPDANGASRLAVNDDLVFMITYPL